MIRRLGRSLVVTPIADVLSGLERALDGGWIGFAKVFLGLGLGWWLYVPLHELLHAFGCLAAGGTVSRLEVAPLYGGGLLERLFPFVVAGGEYAGRLAGFDTGGSDLVYLATDLAPFLLTLFPGVWLLRRAGRAAGKAAWAVVYGAALPFALAPFLSVTGDAYEIGSIVVSQLPPWSEPATAELLRADDLPKRVGELADVPAAPWGGVVLAALTGVAWAFLTYAAGSAIAGALGLTRKVPSEVG